MFMHIDEQAKVAVEAGADGITAINTMKAMAFDLELGIPVLSNEVGGLSGQSIKSVGVRCVYEISRAVEVPVVGCGGISRWQDAVEYIIAGASAVQIGTAIAYGSIDLFHEINTGIASYLEKKKIKMVGDLVASYSKKRDRV
jgi:dihydroorotate dehydrogenase (NAD+) catalytic subunit